MIEKNAPKWTGGKSFNYPASLLASLIASLCSAVSPVLANIIQLCPQKHHTSALNGYWDSWNLTQITGVPDKVSFRSLRAHIAEYPFDSGH